jgi:hypothetical protein
MAKLDVGKALEKLRGTEPRKSRLAQLDEQIAEVNKETQRLRAANRRLERDQRAGGVKKD